MYFRFDFLWLFAVSLFFFFLVGEKGRHKLGITGEKIKLELLQIKILAHGPSAVIARQK